MTSPLKFNVAALVRGPEATGMPRQCSQTGPAPQRIGVEMIAIPQGADITVDVTLTPLGNAIMADADVTGTLSGECARCLAPISRPLDLHVTQVFAVNEDFITGDGVAEEDKGSGDEVPEVDGDYIDLLQAVIDEAGLTLPFAPTCDGECDIDTPDNVTTGVVGEDEDKVDPRWAGLEKFL